MSPSHLADENLFQGCVNMFRMIGRVFSTKQRRKYFNSYEHLNSISCSRQVMDGINSFTSVSYLASVAKKTNIKYWNSSKRSRFPAILRTVTKEATLTPARKIIKLQFERDNKQFYEINNFTVFSVFQLYF